MIHDKTRDQRQHRIIDNVHREVSSQGPSSPVIIFLFTGTEHFSLDGAHHLSVLARKGSSAFSSLEKDGEGGFSGLKPRGQDGFVRDFAAVNPPQSPLIRGETN